MAKSPVDPKLARTLASIRRRLDGGRKRYVTTRGVLGTGLPLFLAMSLLPSLGMVPWLRESAEAPVFNILTGAVLWPLAGYLLGLVLWRSLEWRHDALMRKR